MQRLPSELLSQFNFIKGIFSLEPILTDLYSETHEICLHM